MSRSASRTARATPSWSTTSKLVNDEMVIPFYLANGATFAEANDWVISGCCENRLVNRETQVTGGTIVNYGACVEIPRTWNSYDEVWKAFSAQYSICSSTR